MSNPFTRKLLGFILIVMLVPAAALADMSVTYQSNVSQSSILVKADDEVVVISFGPDVADSPILTALSNMQMSKINLWIIENANEGAVTALRNVIASVDVHNVWLGQGLRERQSINSLLNEYNLSADTAVSRNQFSVGTAEIAIESNNLTDVAVHIGYGSAGFAFFNSIEAANISSFLKSSDMMYIANTAQGSTYTAGSIPPVFAVLDSQTLSDTDTVKLADTLMGSKISVLMNAAAAFSVSTDGKAINLTDITAFGSINKAKVNVRSAPSAESKRVKGLSKNTTVVITGLTAENANGEKWYQIDLNGQTAYVRSDLVTPVSADELKLHANQNSSTVVKKTPKPAVDTVSGGTKKGH